MAAFHLGRVMAQEFQEIVVHNLKVTFLPKFDHDLSTPDRSHIADQIGVPGHQAAAPHWRRPIFTRVVKEAAEGDNGICISQVDMKFGRIMCANGLTAPVRQVGPLAPQVGQLAADDGDVADAHQTLGRLIGHQDHAIAGPHPHHHAGHQH